MPYHEIIDVEEEERVLTSIFNIKGWRLARIISFEVENAVNQELREDPDTCKEKFESWTGNEGCRGTHFYHKSCLIVIPNQERYKLLTSGNAVDLDIWISDLMQKMLVNKWQAPAREGLEKLCSSVVDK